MRGGSSSWTAQKLLDLGNLSSLGDGAPILYHYPTMLDSRSPVLGMAGGSVEAQEDGDSYALVSTEDTSSLYLYLSVHPGIKRNGKYYGIIRRNVQLHAVPREP